jgi:hypothetical protein
MKIALVAMSGIRVCDQELLNMGLTLPGFVERSKVIASLPSLGLLTLAGMTPPQHEVRYVEVADTKIDGPSRAVMESADLVAVSSFSAQMKEAYRLADELRAKGIPVVMGGLHATCLPVQTSRGCSHRCEFCASSVLLTSRYKQKPAEKVLAEIDRIREVWKHPFIEFADDNTFVNKKHSKELMRALARQQVRWFTETDVSVADDTELLDLMRDSGCEQVLIGFESPSAVALAGVEQAANWKARQVDRYLAAIDRLQSRGITVNGCFVLGLDRSGPDSFEAIWRFVKESGLFEVQITVQTPFPGTPLYDRLRREGRLLYEGAWERCTLFDVTFQPSDMTVSQLEAGLRDLGSRLYNAESTRERRRAFFTNLRRRRSQAVHHAAVEEP